MDTYETLAVSLENAVAQIELNRPGKANAVNAAMWRELRKVFDWLDATPQARICILSGRGKHFCAGIDVQFLIEIKNEVDRWPEGRRQERLRHIIVDLQAAVNAIERCRKPVLAAVHGACVGGAVDLIAACDMRYASDDARFSIKEVDLAIVADLGTLQRLPPLIGDGRVRELAYSGREFDGRQAYAMGLINQLFPDRPSLLQGVMALAADISAKSPLTIRGIKETLNYSRSHTIADGLSFVATRNAAMLLSKDVEEAISAQIQKRTPKFED